MDGGSAPVPLASLILARDAALVVGALYHRYRALGSSVRAGDGTYGPAPLMVRRVPRRVRR